MNYSEIKVEGNESRLKFPHKNDKTATIRD